MILRWTGAALVVAGCGGFGLNLAAGHRRQERMLTQLMCVLSYMEWELQYRMTALPELCRMASREATGALRQVLLRLAVELDSQACPDAAGCMQRAVEKTGEFPPALRRLLGRLGAILGRFDLPGQTAGLQQLQQLCRKELRRLEEGRDARLRSYSTLGFCAGAALAILLL